MAAKFNNPINYSLCNFVAYPSGTLTGFGTNYKQLAFNLTMLNDESNYSTSTYTYTVPITGTYLINMEIALTGITSSYTECQYLIYVGGVSTYIVAQFNPYACASSGTTLTLPISTVVSLTAAQALTFYLYFNGSGTVISVGTSSSITGILLK